MTSSALKWIALITMLIDHIGLLFFSDIELFRIIGRIAFPIFAFLIVQGFVHTKSRFMYGLLLLLFAVISEIPYDLCMHHQYFNWQSQNVLFELFIGLCALVFMEKAIKKSPFWFLLVLLMGACSQIFYTSYGLYGITLIVVFYILRSFRGADILGFIGLTYLFYNFTNWNFTYESWSYNILQINSIQMYCLMATVPLVFYNNKKGTNSLKWLFYIFYPVHLIALYFIDVFIIDKFV